jgi:hypothetical protein
MISEFDINEYLMNKIPDYLLNQIRTYSHKTIGIRHANELLCTAILRIIENEPGFDEEWDKWSIAQEMRAELYYIGEKAFKMFMYTQVVEHIEYAYVSRFFFNAFIYECTTDEHVERYPDLKVDIHGMTRYTCVVICAHLSGATILDFHFKNNAFDEECAESIISFDDFGYEYQLNEDIRPDLQGCRLFRGTLYKLYYIRDEGELEMHFGGLDPVM